jgi:3-hydroxybutyryl-CoA dehydrogenase
MTIEMIKHVGVAGSGAMGSQIAMVCALHGYSVVLQDIEEKSLMKAKENLQIQMDKRIKKGRLSEEEVNAAFDRLNFSLDIKDFECADIVIEAIVEKLEAKRELFEKLDEICPAHTILATNSSTIVSSKLADATKRPDKVCNIHFFNPALVMECVEVVKGPHTSDETANTAMEFVKSIGKLGVLLKKEISGFIANRILWKIRDEALYLLENGYATHEEIDLIVTKSLGHPIGPFALTDLTGLDVAYLVKLQRYQESGDDADKPSKIIEEKVKRGELGRKTGKGFYTYNA